mgnify:CR=1 FL=1
MLDAHFDREYFELAYWLLGYSWTQPLEDLLAPIISRHCVQVRAPGLYPRAVRCMTCAHAAPASGTGRVSSA